MPSPEQRDYAALLLRKAIADATTVAVLVDCDEIADDILGFHAQQAIEKSLKAVLVLFGVEFPRTHDLGFLTEMLAREGVPLPPELARAASYTPWAVEFRYDDPAPPLLDRELASATAQAAHAFAAGHLDPAAAD